MVQNKNVGKFSNSIKYGSAVQLYHKKNGDIVYYIGYHDQTDLDTNGKPKRKRIKIGTKSEGINELFAKHKRDALVVALRIGEVPSILLNKQKKEILNFESLSDRYFNYRVEKNLNQKDQKNIKNDKSILKNHLAQFFKYEINSITNLDIEKLKNCKLKELAPKTVNNILTLLFSILNFAIEQDLIKSCPKIKKLTGLDNQRERYFNQDEIKLILEKVQHQIILSIFVKLSLSTGGRLETMRAIKLKDINFSDRTISLIDFKGRAAGKNNATYTGFFKQDMQEELQKFVKGLSPNSYIFSYTKDKQVSKDYIQNNLQKLFNELFNKGLEPSDTKNRAVVHTLRHTFATQLAKAETPIFTIQKLMNHSDIKMTLRYAKFSPENGQNAINNLNLF